MPNRPGFIDLHMHSTVSDGTDTPQALLEAVRSAGIGVFSVTDHDAVRAGKEIRELLKKGDPRFITGAEFSCKDTDGKCHILAYGFDPDAEPIVELVNTLHALRMQKAFARVQKLETEYGFTFPDEERDALFAMANPGKPHIANMMVRCGYAQTKEEAILRYLNPIRLHAGSLKPQEVIGRILAGGGIPVLAHPLFGSGSDDLDDVRMEQRLQRLTACGLQGVEAYYSGFSAQQSARMLSLAERFDLYVTAGSDYHGTNKTVRLGETGFDGTAERPDGMERFLALFE